MTAPPFVLLGMLEFSFSRGEAQVDGICIMHVAVGCKVQQQGAGFVEWQQSKTYCDIGTEYMRNNHDTLPYNF
jgi:hypothetical protein